VKLLSYCELKPKKGINYSRDHLRRKYKNKEFPAPVQISDRRIAFIEAEVDAWLACRQAERDGKAPTQSLRRGRYHDDAPAGSTADRADE
jgi:prophage regulatory protein